jgi:hypothetical protein
VLLLSRITWTPTERKLYGNDPDNLEIVRCYRKEIRDLKAERDAANVKLTQMVVWLEANQPDVFKRGIWDSLK